MSKVKEITYCEFCKNENPKLNMKTCSRKCADELKKINSRETRNCLYCKNKFIVRKKEAKQLCSEECRSKWVVLPENIESRINASKKSIKDNFGVNNVFQLKEIKEKLKKTKFEKYGDEKYNNSEKMLDTKSERYGEKWGINWYKKVENEMIKNYGVNHALQLKEFLDKKKETSLSLYGTEHASQNEDVKNKIKDTCLTKFGTECPLQNAEVKEKGKQTNLEKYGVTHHFKDYDLFQKHLKTQYKIRQYKDTELYYQASYELYFLEKMEEKGKLHEVTRGKTYEFEWENKKHTYHSDFFYNGENIEIKSGWTYNNNGKDLKLESFNRTKWKSVKDFGDKITVLIDKSAIDNFILNLSI